MDGLRLDFDLRQAETLARAFASAPALVATELGRAALEASLLIEREAKENAPTAHVTFRASIRSEPPRMLGDRIVGVVMSPLAYAEPVELGTKPHRPPIAPLADWARVKLGLRGDEAESAAWGIARKIEREGTEGRFPLSRALAENAPQVEAIMTAAVGRIAAALATAGAR
jgi:hypothetical protein